MGKIKKLLLGLTVLISFSSILLITANKPDSSVPNFQFPVKCQLTNDCWISEYPDVDPTSDWHDYSGGKRTTNSHLGTDIIIENLDKMQEGVPVLAASGGTVVATRDGVRDINVKEIGANTVDKIGCGNAAVINLGNGWTNIYCHMKKGSVTVHKGDRVITGQKLGYVGMSGLAETPHLHFQVQHFKETVDPFTGNSLNTDEKINHSLWQDNTLKQIKYYPAFIYNIGITDRDPNIMNLQSGNITPVKVTTNTQAIYLWADIFGLDKDDSVHFLIKDSKGKPVVDKSRILEKSNVRRFFYLKHNYDDLKLGTYNAVITLHKKGFDCTKKIKFKVISD